MQSVVTPHLCTWPAGWPYGACSMPHALLSLRFQLIFADHLHFNFCESLRILAMSRSTRNSWDAGLFPGVASAVLPDVSVQSSQPATSSIPAVASVASLLTAAQLSPDCLAAIVHSDSESFHSGRGTSWFALAIVFVACKCSCGWNELLFATRAWGRSWSGFRRSSVGFAGLRDRFLAAISTSVDFVFSR